MEELRFLILFTVIDNRMILHIETNWNCHRPQNVQQKYRLVCSFIVHTCGTKQFESILDCKPLKVSTVCQLPPRCCLIKQAFNHIYLPITQWETAVAITKNKPLFLIPNSILLFPHVTLHLFLMLLCLSLSFCLSHSLTLSAFSPLAYHIFICHIYNGNIQIYRCYQLITSALITIQLTSVSTRHAAGRPALSLLNHTAQIEIGSETEKRLTKK